MIAIEPFYIDKINEKDAWPLCNFIVSNQERFTPYLPKTVAQNLTPDLSKFFIEKKTKQFLLKEEFLFTIKENDSNALAGLVYIKKLDWQKKQGEFAYCIGYQFEGKNLTSKAVKALSLFSFEELELKTLQIIVHESNVASKKVAQRCGFSWQKTLLKEYKNPKGEILDMELYELKK